MTALDRRRWNVLPIDPGVGDLFYDGSVDRWWLLTLDRGWLQLPDCFFPNERAREGIDL